MGEQGRAQEGRHRRLLVVVTVLGTLTIAVCLDGLLRDRELGVVLDHIEKTEQVMAEASNRLDEIDVAATRDESARGSDWSDYEAKRWSDTAEEAATDLLVAIEELEDEDLLPWHRTTNKARQRYLEHARAWLELYESWAEDEDKPAGVSIRIRATWKLTHDALDAATVPLLGRSDSKRIERIFSDVEDD